MERDLLISLVTRAQKNDSTAMNELFSAFYNDVYYFALKTVKDSDTACDITQETFLEIIHTIGDLKEPAAFVTWMKQITYHQCTRYFKKKKEVLVEEDEDGNTIFDTLADESEGSIPSEVYEKEEFRNTILGIINELTEEQRSAVMMYYFDELPVGQIAGIQGVSEGTVKSRLNYARKAIKKSVESYEKKHNIKLHSFSFLPLFLLFFGQELMPEEKAAEVGAAVLESASTMGTSMAATSGAVGGTAIAASVEATATATGVGLVAKIAALPIATKIVACIVAAAVVIGGSLAMFGGNKEICKDANQDCVCDSCGKECHHIDADLDHNVFCVICGAHLGIVDENLDGICDDCGEYPCGPVHNQEHVYTVGNCKFCGLAEEIHFDETADGYCDHCGEAMCQLELGEHRIPDGRCLCEICEQGTHTEGETHPFCRICSERLPIDDRNGDGVCDVCGEHSCGGSYHGNSHEDKNSDDLCDICMKHMCGLVWGLEHNINYDDGIYDGKCDDCGGTPYAMGYGEDDRPHADANNDGICDCCSAYLCNLPMMSEFGGVDANGDEKCDICKLFLCDGHDGTVYHYDFDKDGKCDRCSHYICAHGYLPHTDENGDRVCDKCFSYV